MDDDARDSGWLTFAAVILVFAGIMKIFDSIWAFRTKGSIPSDSAIQHLTLGNNLKAYGWYWLIIGVILIFAGFAVLQKSQVGRWIGIIAAAIGALGSMAWMPYEPIWAITYVVIALLVIYALAAHGGLEVPEQLTGGSSGPPQT